MYTLAVRDEQREIRAMELGYENLYVSFFCYTDYYGYSHTK
jgi:hypothetical protein